MPRNVLPSLMLACAVSPSFGAVPEASARAIVEGTNVFRKAQGLEPVTPSANLQSAAREFAQFMAQTGKYGHRADGRRPSARAAAQGYDYCIVSENIAYEFRSTGFDSEAALADRFVEGWKNSPEHRKNMTDPAVTQTGVGVAQGRKGGEGQEGRYFAVQLFGRPKSAAIEFSVHNESGEGVTYRIGGRQYKLGPRVVRSHTLCRQAKLAINPPGGGKGISAPLQDGAQYIVREDGVITE